ncbi:MAG: cytochrome c3 family protein [Firmicutes bacterium]|nr:cytochrome c3 family protein [Bacillota bacterium]
MKLPEWPSSRFRYISYILLILVATAAICILPQAALAAQLTVISEPVARGSVTTNASSGQTYIPMQAITLMADSGSITVTAIQIAEYGDGVASTNIANVWIYKETNSRAGFQSPNAPDITPDTLVATSPGTFQSGEETTTFSFTVSQTVTTEPSVYYIVYKIKNSATVGTTVGSRLENESAILVSGGDTVAAFSNLQSRLLPIVSSPHGTFSTTSNLCQVCHTVHLAPDFSNETTLSAGTTFMILNRSYLKDPDTVNNYSHTAYNYLCEACHNGTGASTDIKADYDDSYSPETAGHLTKHASTYDESTSSGTWSPPPAGKHYNAGVKIPCSICHDVHVSNKGNSKMLADGLYDYQTKPVAQGGGGWTDPNGDGKITAGTDEVCLVCHARPTESNRNSIVMGIKLSINVTSPNHDTRTGCTKCHKPHTPYGESKGGLACGGCHDSIYNPMHGQTSSYHHYMASASTGHPTDSPAGSNYDLADGKRTCLMCHVDHDYFRSDINANNTTGRSRNLRAAIQTPPVKTDLSTYLATDFDNSQTYGGICMSCHSQASFEKDRTNQKDDNSTSTPVLNKAGYNSSTHNYTTGVTSSYPKDSSTYTGNCVKCHNDSMTKDFQTSTLKFTTHDSTYRYILTNNGTASGGTGSPTASAVESTYNSLEENFCYVCHSGGTESGDDIYGKNMSANAKNVYEQFTTSSIVSKHPIASAAGKHFADEASSTTYNWNMGTNRHVECTDCHNPHAAQAGVHSVRSSTIGAALIGVWGVSVNYSGVSNFTNPSTSTAYSRVVLTSTSEEWQLCFKCHSNYAYGTTVPSLPSGGTQTNIPKEFNPGNASLHGVTGASKILSTVPNSSFNNGWTTSSRMTCTDCHTASSMITRGPHGSTNKWLLKAKYNPDENTLSNLDISGQGANGSFALCFLCHAWNTYAGNGSANSTGYTDGYMNLHVMYEHKYGTSYTIDGSTHIVTCTTCHSRIPHGMNKEHLIATAGYQAGAPGQPYWNGQWGAASRPQINRFIHPSNHLYSENNCGTNSGSPSGDYGCGEWVHDNILSN